MMKLKDESKNWEPIPEVPWRDMTDEEFAKVELKYDAQFSPEQAGSLRRWFDHVSDDNIKGGKR